MNLVEKGAIKMNFLSLIVCFLTISCFSFLSSHVLHDNVPLLLFLSVLMLTGRQHLTDFLDVGIELEVGNGTDLADFLSSDLPVVHWFCSVEDHAFDSWFSSMQSYGCIIFLFLNFSLQFLSPFLDPFTYCLEGWSLFCVTQSVLIRLVLSGKARVKWRPVDLKPVESTTLSESASYPPQILAGYGVEMQVKSTEYNALNLENNTDTSTSSSDGILLPDPFALLFPTLRISCFVRTKLCVGINCDDIAYDCMIRFKSF